VINVRIIGTAEQARDLAIHRNGGRAVYIKGVFWVRDGNGGHTRERDFVFATIMGGGS